MTSPKFEQKSGAAQQLVCIKRIKRSRMTRGMSALELTLEVLQNLYFQ